MNLIAKDSSRMPTVHYGLVSPMSCKRCNMAAPESDPFQAEVGITVPAANVTENRWELRIALAAPGFERKDFKIEVENGQLSICVHHEAEEENGQAEYRAKEFSFGSFCRTFVLPDHIMEESIHAVYENGLLKIVIPKLKETPLKPVYKVSVS